MTSQFLPYEAMLDRGIHKVHVGNACVCGESAALNWARGPAEMSVPTQSVSNDEGDEDMQAGQMMCSNGGFHECSRVE